MKLFISLIFCLISSFAFSQIKDPWKSKPESIEQSLEYLDLMFDDTSKYTFTVLPEDIATSRLHRGFGMWMRNNWGLWGSSRLKEELIDSGFVHPDDMSSILLKAYHRKLNGKPLNLNADAEAYRAYWSKSQPNGFSAGDIGVEYKKPTSKAELMEYFPPGDTIVVSIYAEHKKLFQTYGSSVNGIAVVKAHKNTSLLVKLISIQHKKKHHPEREVNEEYEVNPIYCSLIPPVGWSTK